MAGSFRRRVGRDPVLRQRSRGFDQRLDGDGLVLGPPGDHLRRHAHHRLRHQRGRERGEGAARDSLADGLLEVGDEEGLGAADEVVEGRSVPEDDLEDLAVLAREAEEGAVGGLDLRERPRAFSRAASTVAFRRRTVSSTTASKSASLSGKCR